MSHEGTGSDALSNPFATKWTRPGTMPYIFPGDETALSLITRLVAQSGWGQIIGPHGTGKTSLLRTLRPHLEDAGFQLEWHELHADQRRLGRGEGGTAEAGPRHSNTLVVVDGYEQLSWLARGCLRLACWWRGAGLLVTAHRDLGLPLLLATKPSLELAGQLAKSLVQAAGELPDEAEIERIWREKAGNLRELWFALYDHHEARRRPPRANT